MTYAVERFKCEGEEEMWRELPPSPRPAAHWNNCVTPIDIYYRCFFLPIRGIRRLFDLDGEAIYSQHGLPQFNYS